MSAGSPIASPASSATRRRSRSTTTRVLTRTTSSISEEINSTARPSARNLAIELFDLRLGPDVDAARGLIKDDQGGPGGQPPGEENLLLVAAGKIPDRGLRAGGLDPQRLDIVVAEFLLLGAGQRPPCAPLRLQREDEVLAHRQVGQDALGFAVLRAKGHPVPHRRAHRTEPDPVAGEADPAAVGVVNSEEQPGGLRPARAEQAGEPGDLAAAEREIEGMQRTAPAEAMRLEQRGGGRWERGRPARFRSARPYGGELATEHPAHQRKPRQFGRNKLADQRAVAEHRDPVANRIHLLEKMGHKHYAQALRAQLPHDLEQLPDLLLVEAGGGLVEDQELRAQIERACDGHHLLDRQRQQAEFGVHIALISSRASASRAWRRSAGQFSSPNFPGWRPSSMFSATDSEGMRLTSW